MGWIQGMKKPACGGAGASFLVMLVVPTQLSLVGSGTEPPVPGGFLLSAIQLNR